MASIFLHTYLQSLWLLLVLQYLNKKYENVTNNMNAGSYMSAVPSCNASVMQWANGQIILFSHWYPQQKVWQSKILELDFQNS